MHSSLPYLCSPASYLHHSSITLPLPNGLFFLSTNHKRAQRGNLVLFAALKFSSRDFSPNTIRLIKKTERLYPRRQDSSDIINNSGIEQIWELPIVEDEDEKPNLDKRICRLHVQGMVDKIRVLPNTQKIGIFDFIKKDYSFETISGFNDLLMALFVANEHQLALELYSALSSFVLEPDCGTYSLLIRCYCKKDDPCEANRALNEMVKNGFQPNVAIFTELINSFCKRGRMQKAFEVFEVMGRVGCEPTINTYNCLLKGLCYVGRIEEAYKMLMNIKTSSKKLDVYTYTAVMNGLCKVGRSNEALELLDGALEMGLVPNVVIYNTLFNGYFKEGRPLEGIGLLNQMKERNCMPDYISYSTLLHGLLKWGKIRAAFRIYKEMVESGFEVDERMMNTLLRGLCRRSRMEKEMLKDAYEVFERMKSGVYAIYPCAYDLVIEAFCIGKAIDRALASLREMVRIGHSPGMITFNNVIGVLCVEGKLKEALSVLVLVYEDSNIAGAFPFDVLINEFNRQGMSLGACNVYGAALKRGVVPEMKPR